MQQNEPESQYPDKKIDMNPVQYSKFEWGGGCQEGGGWHKRQERGCGQGENHMVVCGEGKRSRGPEAEGGASGRARVLEEREGGRRRRIRGLLTIDTSCTMLRDHLSLARKLPPSSQSSCNSLHA